MSQTVSGSVTQWIEELRSGDTEAAGKLWQRYFADLVRVASGQLRGAPRAVADEEDVALSVFDTVVRKVSAGKLPQLHDRHDLWRLLIFIVRQKSIDHRRTQGRMKRGGGSLLQGDRTKDDARADVTLDELLEKSPQPDDVAAMREELRGLLESMPDDALQRIAIAKLEGYGNQEIAAQLAVTERTVERKLQVIRTLWLHKLAAPAE